MKGDSSNGPEVEVTIVQAFTIVVVEFVKYTEDRYSKADAEHGYGYDTDLHGLEHLVFRR